MVHISCLTKLVPDLYAINIFSFMNRSLHPEPELENPRPTAGFIPSLDFPTCCSPKFSDERG